MESLPLRDFRYLDSERVRSLLSQLAQGAPETFEHESSKSASGGVDFFAKLVGEVQSVSSESRAAHHYQYTLLERLLEDSNRVQRVSGDLDVGELLDAEDGKIILATGRLRSLDSLRLKSLFENAGQLMALSTTFELRQQGEASRAGKKTANRRVAAAKKLAQERLGASDNELQEISRILSIVFQDRVRFRVMPWSNDPTFVSGSLNRDFLTADEEPVFSRGAYVLGGDWTAAGIVTSLEADEPPEGDTSLEGIALGVLSSLSWLNDLVTQGAGPSVSILPLAIYREI